MNVLARLGHELRLLQVALQYFTRLPTPSFAQFDPSWLSQSVRYFPIAGMVVGAIGACVLLLCTHLLSMPIAIAALLALAATVIATGAFHEDGLADTFDALGGHVRRERALEIMRDSRIGTYGAAALGVGLLLRWQAITALPPWFAAIALICAHAVARAGAASLMATLAYVRLEDDAKAKPVAQDLRLGNLLATMLAGLLPAAVSIAILQTMWRPICAGLIAVVVVRIFCAVWFRRRLGGYTGDALGCCEQLGEIAFMLAVVTAMTAASG
jgi:adenosylcobinamide-GDP ribazoletransferase